MLSRGREWALASFCYEFWLSGLNWSLHRVNQVFRKWGSRHLEVLDEMHKDKPPQCRFCVILDMRGKVPGEVDQLIEIDKQKIGWTTQNKLPQYRIFCGFRSMDRFDKSLSSYWTIVPQWVPWFVEFWIRILGKVPSWKCWQSQS